MSKILIVIDMQNDFITGSLGSIDAYKIIRNVRDKVEQCIKDGYRIFFTMDTHKEESYAKSHEGKFLPVEHCIFGTEGWEIIPELKQIMPEPSENCMILYKNSFGISSWDSYIIYRFKDILDPEGFKQTIEIVGVCTDICVISNALVLRSQLPNAEIIVHADCCAGTTPEKHKAALEVMKSCHITVIGE